MPDHWDTKAGRSLQPPDEQPDQGSNGHDDPSNEVRLKEDRGRLRLPADILIALRIAVAALVLVAVGLLVMHG